MKDFFTGVRLFLVLTVLTGIVYPLAVTGIGQGLFREKANGSLIQRDGKIVGSRIIGQAFDDTKFFWGRPSATGPFPYNAAASGGSNLGPTNPALKEAIEGRVKALKDAGSTGAVPTELVTTSGSGLDPHLSPTAALYQAERVAKARNLPVDQVKELVAKHTTPPALGLLGEPVVNVLELNLDLESIR